MNLDFNSKSLLGEKLVSLIDAAIDDAGRAETPRDYLGGSEIGEECERRLQYSYLKAPGSNDFNARVRRIFRRGHVLEDVMAEWLRGAGFTLSTHRPNGRQHGFSDCDGRFKGHADGVIVEAPEPFKAPALWENKVLGAKGWSALKRHGLRKQYPKYAAQVALYQAYLKLAEHPAIFTALNADTMEIEVLLVPFDAELAQQQIDKAARVLTAIDHQEMLPRAAGAADAFVCKFCPYRGVCWDGRA